MKLCLFLGPDKAGSSWMFRLAAWHPQIAVPKAKDLFFFDRFYDRGVDWYESRFPTSEQARVRLEICHDYLFSAAAAHRIHHHYPGARLLVCLRHPVDRAVSSYHYMVRQGRVDSDFSTAIRKVDELIDHGRYGAHLSTYLSIFPREQLHVLDFDLLQADPQSFARSFFRSLGVTPEEPPPELLAPARAASRPRLASAAKAGKWLANVLRQYGHENLLSRLKDSRTIERALFRELRPGEKVRPTQQDIAHMRGNLKRDAELLDHHLGTTYAQRWWSSSAGGPTGDDPARSRPSIVNKATTRAGATYRYRS